MENILRLRDDKNFSKQRYRHVIKLFLEKYPDSTFRQRSRHLDGHTYPQNSKIKNKQVTQSNIYYVKQSNV